MLPLRFPPPSAGLARGRAGTSFRTGLTGKRGKLQGGDRRVKGDYHGLRGRGVRGVRHLAGGDERVGLGKVRASAAAGNVVAHRGEAAGGARLAAEGAGGGGGLPRLGGAAAAGGGGGPHHPGGAPAGAGGGVP